MMGYSDELETWYIVLVRGVVENEVHEPWIYLLRQHRFRACFTFLAFSSIIVCLGYADTAVGGWDIPWSSPRTTPPTGIPSIQSHRRRG